MKRYRVYGVVYTEFFAGEYEAESEEEAIDKAEMDKSVYSPRLCTQCSNKVEMNEDIDSFRAEEV